MAPPPLKAKPCLQQATSQFSIRNFLIILVVKQFRLRCGLGPHACECDKEGYGIHWGRCSQGSCIVLLVMSTTSTALSWFCFSLTGMGVG